MSTGAKNTTKPCGLPLWPRGLASIILLGVAQVFHICSVTTPLIEMKRDIQVPVAPGVVVPAYNEVIVGVMKSRIIVDFVTPTIGDRDDVIDTNELPGSCSELHRRTNGLRAMFFTSLALCAICIILAILNACGLIPSIVIWALLLLTIVIGLTGVLLAFLIWENTDHYCSNLEAWKDRDGAKIWSATPCLAVAAALETIATILLCCLPKGPHDELCGTKAASARFDKDMEARGVPAGDRAAPVAYSPAAHYAAEANSDLLPEPLQAQGGNFIGL